MRLQGGGPGKAHLEAHPPLLFRVKGHSRWGAFAYRPVLARQGRRITREHRLLLTLWGRLLETWQDGPVPLGLVVARGGRHPAVERVALSAGWQCQLDTALLALASELGRDRPGPILDDRRKCGLCSWRELCSREASRTGHLGDVSGIGAKRRQLLSGLGIDNVEDLARQDPDVLAASLERHGDQHRDAAFRLVAQARVQRLGTPWRWAPGPCLPELQGAEGVLLYDIESDPDCREDFLHGFLSLQRSDDGSWPFKAGAYQPLLLRAELGEARHWRRIQGFLERYPDWPILHYGETESMALVRLAKRQGVPSDAVTRLRGRLIDVHARLRAHWLLPVSSYGLKAVAAWRGFRWRQKGVEGARALLWWRLWKAARGPGPGRRLLLRRILTYNQDDCLATWAVASWLLGADAQALPPDPTGGSTKPEGAEIRRAGGEAVPSP